MSNTKKQKKGFLISNSLSSIFRSENGKTIEHKEKYTNVDTRKNNKIEVIDKDLLKNTEKKSIIPLKQKQKQKQKQKGGSLEKILNKLLNMPSLMTRKARRTRRHKMHKKQKTQKKR